MLNKGFTFLFVIGSFSGNHVMNLDCRKKVVKGTQRKNENGSPQIIAEEMRKVRKQKPKYMNSFISVGW